MTPWIRTQDFVWLLLFSALAIASPTQDAPSLFFLFLLGILQVVEPRIAAFRSRRGNAFLISLKLLLCYLVMGYTDAINSSYYPILLLPVVSAATTMGAIGTAAFTLLAVAFYLSFLLFLDLQDMGRYLFEWKELLVRVAFLPIVGYLTYTMSKANRVSARNYQTVAQELEMANRHLREAEVAMRRSDRLAALGQLTAGLAHELRNPMGTIRASAEMLRKSLPADSAVAAEMTGFIASEVDRADSLIKRFLEFARPLPLRKKPTELNEVLDRAVEQLERGRARSEVMIYKNFDPEIRPLMMDGEWMERVFYNLLLNAVQASPQGAAVTLRTRNLTEHAEVAVIDRGCGIAPENRESIFNPFFTTKSEGVGLGLAIVSKIVDEHNGSILVESDPGKGSIFRVMIPKEGN